MLGLWNMRMSLVWYTLSYIPYGQKMGWRLLTKCLNLRGVFLVGRGRGQIAMNRRFGLLELLKSILGLKDLKGSN